MVSINYPGMEPIECQVLSDEPRIFPPTMLEAEIADDGELRFTGGRASTLLQFYSDRGMRTVRLADITVL